jgi:hypothetical protein
MKRFVLLLMFIFLSFQLQAQPHTKQSYVNFINEFFNSIYLKSSVTIEEAQVLLGKNGVMEFEEYLFDKQCSDSKKDSTDCNSEFRRIYLKGNNTSSLLFSKIKHELINAIGIRDHLPQLICDSITKNKDYVLFKVTLDKHQSVYLTLNRYSDEEIFVIDLFLPDGSSIYNKVDPDEIKEYLEIPGAIKDKDGYVNIRETPNNKSKIIGVIKRGESFYYTPNVNSFWWKIKANNSKVKGYVYYDRIKVRQ